MSELVIANPFGVAERQDARGLVQVEQQRAVAEVQARMMIARSNPRDERIAMDKILEDCSRVSLAEHAEYEYSRGGTDISGPSIRLAESVARRWGNIASGIKEIARGNGYSECVAYAWDLETGFYDERQFQVRHWRDTRSGGYALKDERDVYELIANMGQRRKRAVLLSVIPGDVIEAAQRQCRVTLKTKVEVTPELIKDLIDKFSEHGVTKEQIEKRIQRNMSAITPAQVVRLKSAYNSLKDGIGTASDFFDVAPTETAPDDKHARGVQGLKAKIEKRKEPEQAAPPTAAPPSAEPTASGHPSLGDVVALLKCGDLDAAADIAQRLTGADAEAAQGAIREAMAK